MSFLPLTLGVRRQPDAEEAGRVGRAIEKKQSEKTLNRDGFSCRCCGFTSKKFQRVIQDPAMGPDTDALITVCTFCEMCLQLDRAGLSGAGVLIWLPELSQADLNHVVRSLYIAKSSGGPLEAAASRTLDVLLARRAEAKKRLGTDDPLILSTALTEAVDNAAYTARGAKLEGIRLLLTNRYVVRQGGRDVDAYPSMQSYWMSSEGPFARTPVQDWIRLFESVAAKAV